MPGTPPEHDPGRGTNNGRGHVPIIAGGLTGWFALLWFGVVVLGDNPARSAVVAAVVVALAVAGWILAGPRRT